MNDDERQQHRERVLRKRAERLAYVEKADAHRKLLFQIAVVLVGGQRIGIPVHHLRELLRTPPITLLPGLPEWLLGVTQVRGEIISVVDLARWLDIKGSSQPWCLVVLEGPVGLLGMLADQNAGFCDVYEEEVARDLQPEGKLQYVSLMTRDLCAILDVPKILADPRLMIGAGPAMIAAGVDDGQPK